MITSLIDSPKRIGWWIDSNSEPFSDDKAMFQAISRINSDLYVVKHNEHFALCSGGSAFLGENQSVEDKPLPILGYIPAFRMEELGDSSFCKTYGLRYPVIGGSMANGICSTEIVEAMGKIGMMAFFGAAGLSIDKVEAAIDRLEQCSETFPFGFNLIHSPNEPHHEAAVVELYLRRKIRLIEASAFLRITLPVVKYRVSGIYRNEKGDIVTPNRVIGKVSRVELATKFFSPPPENFLRILVESGDITEEQAELASQIPLAQDITAEADSGGHTDNRPAITIVPTLIALKDQMQSLHGYKEKLRIGAGGGVATPAAVAAMFSMGVAYVVTGTVNQSCKESGTSDVVREMLAGAKQADVAMAPAADMFAMGVKVQVLKRGTMFAMRAAKLYELYCNYEGLDEIPLKDRTVLEKSIFCEPLDKIWDETCKFFSTNDPKQITRAESEPKHKMALVFRWYLGQSSGWANRGVASRQVDYQIWCGPGMGAFNEWVKGSFLEDFKEREVGLVAMNLLYGAAVNMRLNVLRSQGFSYPADVFRFVPQKLSIIKGFIED